MKLYKPFELFYCSVEKFYIRTGVGSGRLHSDPPVLGLISILQLFNIIALMSLISFYTNFKARFSYVIITIIALFVFNIIYFRDTKTLRMLDEYEDYTQTKRNIIGICSILYILLSFGLLIVSDF